MRGLPRVGLLAVLLCATLSTADEEEKKEGNERLAAAARDFNATCATKITATWDWASEGSSPGKPSSQGPVYCESIIKGLTTGCSDPIARAALVDQIHSVTCRLEPGASKKNPDGAILSLSGTTLTASYDWASSNLDSETYKWLMKKMPTPGPNGPMSVEAKQEKLEGEQRFAEAITAFQDKCGAKIPVTYDFSSEKGFAARPAWQGFLYCKGVIEGLAAACEFEHAKDRVARAVKAVQCRFEQGSFKKTQGSGAVLGLKSGTLTASYEWTSANLDSEARKWVVQLK